ncbi:hypothetical protein GCM10020219_099000 [Nonomuraea dietziae]
MQVQGDGVPDDLDALVRYPLIGEETGGVVGAVDVEGVLAVALVTESGIVEHAAEEQQFVVVVDIGAPALLLAEEAARTGSCACCG